MKRLILVAAIAVFGFSSFSYADELEDAGAQVELGSDRYPGMFCNIETAEVCVVAQNEEDCKKIEGEKVDACPSSQENE